ncbi:MAG TPA: hypothetical protein VFG90_07990 [Nitrososphaeraceae archaeon]|nr:hypothetical protein [Nitrososphaeraceae archaeon]
MTIHLSSSNEQKIEGTINSKKITNCYLINNEEEDEAIRRKLVLTASDKCIVRR